jgi:AcrR family transcriptional regulator
LGVTKASLHYHFPSKAELGRALIARYHTVFGAALEAIDQHAFKPPEKLRQYIDQRLLVITPGIRPVENRPSDDQKRVVSVDQAFRLGADYIVVGRPIRDAADPRAAAEGIQTTIAAAFPGWAHDRLKNDILLRALLRQPSLPPVWMMRGLDYLPVSGNAGPGDQPPALHDPGTGVRSHIAALAALSRMRQSSSPTSSPSHTNGARTRV